MSIDDELNEELGRFGYELETPTLQGGAYQVTRLDGYAGYTATFGDVQELRTFLQRLAESDNLWCIHLDHGNVDVNRSTGEVTPRDGGPLFNLHDLHPHEWSGASDEASGAISQAALMTAHQICIKSNSRPPYGGLWFKRA
ncbi:MULTISPECIES: hypothetical protein [Mycobacterium]|uniref:Uncharacterized protein n=1 Tax=Mycobacterium paraseoulense TaxID=590652 RepID=A0A1X0I3L9_9MYCO|nr:hypothetical protein [Mycobacterium paraseoulense]MCV7398124.1 hypothetical protein [Mycobacterium paraseoulense]ORB33854.1 hypothetical protein BST39_25200 [Mycobacterium paraseoulense]BBZ70187.1 hypothetical protein MPRS_12800 [Mycobacterium paraseoulense]